MSQPLDNYELIYIIYQSIFYFSLPLQMRIHNSEITRYFRLDNFYLCIHLFIIFDVFFFQKCLKCADKSFKIIIIFFPVLVSVHLSIKIQISTITQEQLISIKFVLVSKRRTDSIQNFLDFQIFRIKNVKHRNDIQRG